MDLISISDAFISSLIFGITSSQSPPNELTPSTSDFILSLPQFHTSTILPLLESEILQFSQTQSNAQSLSCLPSFFLLYRDILVQNNVFPTLPASTESMLSALANLLSKNPQYAFSGKTLALTTSALGAPSTSQVPPTSLFQARLPFSQSESRSFSYLESHDWRTSIAYGTKQLATAIFSPPPPTAIAVLREVPVINVVPFVDPCSTVPVYESDSLILTGFSTNEPSSEHDFVHAAIEANVSKVFSNMASRPKVKAKFKAKPKVKVKPKEKEKVKPKPKEKEKKEKEKKEKKKKEKKEGGEEEKELKRAEKEKKKAAKAAALAAAEDDNDDVNDDTDNDNNAKKEPRASQVRWTAIADSQLRQAKLDPTASWSDVAASITHIVKNPTQARDRWTNFVRPTISLDPWTLEEDLLLVERQNTLGNKWGAIQEGLEGRTEHGCRQRHKAIIKKLGKIGESVLTEENRIDGSIGVPQLPQLPSELPKEMVIEETLEMDIDLGLIIDTIEMLV